MGRAAALATVVAVAVAGCGGGDHAATRIRIVAVNPSVGRAVFDVDCGDASRACQAIESSPRLVTRPKPFVCAGGPFSWWDLTIAGRVRGRAFRSHVATCWTPQMRLIGLLGIGGELRAHMLPRRRENVLAGTTRTFAPGALRAGDVVACRIRSRNLETGVPIEREQTASTGYGGAGVVDVTLEVTRRRDGSVTARCR